ncbi:septum formation protein [Scopulibacillus darangshiensis]|uniref:dTTP/UTP pyrophosphatase n=1 Tax=Scopulibacillus darangshiensis TaxID=442528 RepID=A0A4R2P4U7_9BACL|nr:Maf family protein [Scopulibacillus darangshiensis]TCP28971.1 septum formation protein [Scopulibacillus darangshiensis]
MDNKTKPTLILASSSPRRRELIRTLGMPVEIRKNDVDETISADFPPRKIVEELSMRKAKAAFESIQIEGEHSVVIGSDTIVVHEGTVLGKPKSAEDAFQMLKRLQGETHEVFSGIACIQAPTGRVKVAHHMTQVTMKPLQHDQIHRYIASGEPMDKAGAYAIQGLGATFVEKITGDYFAVVGLPLSLLSDMLSDLEIHVI